MMDLLVKDLDKEMTVARAEERAAQADYESSMADAAEKRAQDSKTLTDNEAARAGVKAKMEEAALAKKSKGKELDGVGDYAMSLHQECDFLLKYYGSRQQARTDEVDSLMKAKSVLNGADYSFLQTGPSVQARASFMLRRA